MYQAQPAESVIKLPETEIERLTDDYHGAQYDALCANANAMGNQFLVSCLEARLPYQLERSNKAMRQQYILESGKYDIIDMLLRSETLEDFIRQSDYIDRIFRANANTVKESRETQERLASIRETLEAERLQADNLLQETAAALREAQDRRASKQASAQANASGQAGSLGGEASIGKNGEGKDQPEDFRIAAMTDTSPLYDGADWYATEEEFIAEWAPRIDAYLSGSALSGQGTNFARSAWRYCVDPRWSPAISNTESSKGAVCIRPHNAWGWGAADSDPYNLASEWGSWEEAIDAHISGLARGYGYTITINGAKTYCPGTWQSWYNNTLSEMARI